MTQPVNVLLSETESHDLDRDVGQMFCVAAGQNMGASFVLQNN
jgi:hypothetical protein